MQLFGLGKKETGNADQAADKAAKDPAKDLRKQLIRVLKLADHYETTIIAVAVAALLAITSLRMLHYMDPPIDDTKVQDILAKNKKIRIDPKVVDKLNQLQDSGTTTPPAAQVESGRTNPFTE
jgi:hypothetical protein